VLRREVLEKPNTENFREKKVVFENRWGRTGRPRIELAWGFLPGDEAQSTNRRGGLAITLVKGPIERTIMRPGACENLKSAINTNEPREGQKENKRGSRLLKMGKKSLPRDLL